MGIRVQHDYFVMKDSGKTREYLKTGTLYTNNRLYLIQFRCIKNDTPELYIVQYVKIVRT